MSAGDFPNEIVFRGIQDVLNAQPTNVQENVEQLRNLKDSLYATVTALMSDVISILGSDRDAYLEYLVGDNNKINMKDIYKNFKTPNRARVDRTLSSLQGTVHKIHLLLQNLDRIYEDSKKNSDLLVQLLEYFRLYWSGSPFERATRIESNERSDSNAANKDSNEAETNVNLYSYEMENTSNNSVPTDKSVIVADRSEQSLRDTRRYVLSLRASSKTAYQLRFFGS